MVDQKVYEAIPVRGSVSPVPDLYRSVQGRPVTAPFMGSLIMHMTDPRRRDMEESNKLFSSRSLQLCFSLLLLSLEFFDPLFRSFQCFPVDSNQLKSDSNKPKEEEEEKREFLRIGHKI